MPALGWASFAAGVVSLAAAAVTASTDLGDRVEEPGPLPALRWSRRLVGAVVAGACIGMAVGVYETCWTLLMHHDHASTLQIRLSWTVFSIPWVALSGLGGWLADHADRRVIALVGLLNAAIFLAIYPRIHHNAILLVLGSLESIGASLSAPAIASLLTEGAHDRELGRRQGLYATVNTASLAAVAAVSGALFTHSPALPFTLVAAVSGTLGLTTIWWWRGVPGRVRPAGQPPAGSPTT